MENFFIIYLLVMGLLALIALVVGIFSFFISMGDRDLTYIIRWSVFPGVGQLINGEKRKGKILLTISILFFGALLVDYLLIVREKTDNAVPLMILLPTCIALQLYSFIDAIIVGSKTGDYKLNKLKEAELQKVLWEDGSKSKQAAPPSVPKGGFQRKVKGTPHFKSLDPLPDEKTESKNNSN